MSIFLMAVLYLITALSAAHASDVENNSLAGRPEVQTFISEMVTRHGFDSASLNGIFSQVQLKPNIIKAITRPAESKTWSEYRSLFLTPVRVDNGENFWHANAGTLALASKTYGVPESMIIAIIGVETLYGKYTGSYRVLDALSTLAFDYPRRAEYFREELENFLLMTREENIDPLSLKGSYAGAMGVAQFMPGSQRRFGVDFDGNGLREIGQNITDAIGSVANYFIAHGWEHDQPVAVRAQVSGERYLDLVNMGFNLTHSIDKMREYGVTPAEPLPGSAMAMLIRLETEGEPEYWLGLNNFKVITAYNRSKYYAMAVYQLSREIQAMHQEAKVENVSEIQ